MIDLTYPAMLELFPEFLAKGRSESASFLMWYLANYYRLEIVEAQDCVCDQGGDRGIDGLFVNDNEQTITFFQSKISQRSNSTIGDGLLRTFAGSLTQFQSTDGIREIIKAGGDSQLSRLLLRFDVAAKVLTHDVRGEYISNIDLDHNGHSFLATNSNMIAVGKTTLTETYISDSRDVPKADEARLDISGFDVTDYIVDAQTRAIIAPVRARELVQLQGISDQSIFAYNVRGPLGKTKVNKDIVVTLRDQSKHKRFPLFHNGITIIANNIERTDDQLIVSDYYVVNGCQSLSSMYDHRGLISDDLRLLVKVIQLDPRSKEAEEITQFSNNQNGVKARDFKANNPIQIRLQNEFVVGYAGQYAFEIKTGEKIQAGRAITNENAGLMLMAFDLKQPWATHRRYEVWEDKYSDLFARPEVTADRIVMLQIVSQLTDEALSDHLENDLFRKYILTKYLMLYAIRLVIDKECPTLIRKSLTFVRDKNSRQKLVDALRPVIAELSSDLNYEVMSLGEDFDYRGRLRDQHWVERLAGSLASARAKEVARKKADPLSISLVGLV